MSWLTDVIATVEAFGKKVNHYATDIGTAIQGVPHALKTAVETSLTLGPKYADRGASPFKGGGPKQHKGSTYTGITITGDPGTHRKTNLRALSKRPDPSERGGSLSNQEKGVAGTIIKKLGLKTPTTPKKALTPTKATSQQWERIQKTAGTRLKNRPKAGTTRAKQYEKEIQSSPYNQIMQAVGKEYAVAQQAAQSAASGSLTAPATQGAWSQALQDLQGAPSSLGMNPSAWLGQNLATEAKTTAPLQQAMSNYGSALQAQQGPIEANLNALGQGLGAEDVTASASAWLSALASHVTANLSYYGEIPQASVGSLSPAVAQALQKSGGYLSGTSKGLVPLSSLTTKGASTKAAKTATGPGTTLSAAGSAPSTGPANAGG